MWLLELSQREMTEALNEFSIEERRQILQSLTEDEYKKFIMGVSQND